MDAHVNLTPELEHFARSCVKSGRFDNVSEVVRSALRLLQESETRRDTFTAMLESVALEAEREKTYTLNEILQEVDEVIEQNTR